MRQVYQFRVEEQPDGTWRAWLDDDETVYAEGDTPPEAMKALCDLLQTEWGAER